MATSIKYNEQVIETLATGKSGVIDFADEKMRGDIIVEAAEDTEVRYKGAVLAKGKKIIIHCAGKIMRGEMRIATSAADGSTTAILGRAILGKAILGRTSSLPKLDAPIIRLVEGDAKKLDAPIIYLDTGTEVKKLDKPTIYLQTDAEIIKLGTPTIYLETEDIPDEPDEPIVIKLDTPTIYIESDPVVPDEPDVPEIVKLDAPEIYLYVEAEPDVPDTPDEPEIVKLNAPVIYIEAEVIPKLTAPEIYLEAESEPDEPTVEYRYVRDDLYVGDNREYTTTHGATTWFTAEYWFSEESGFYGMSNIPIENAVGNHFIPDDRDYTEVWFITNVVKEELTFGTRYHISAFVDASASKIQV